MKVPSGQRRPGRPKKALNTGPSNHGNLKRAKMAVHKMVQQFEQDEADSACRSMEEGFLHGRRIPTADPREAMFKRQPVMMSRKERRKQARQMKKVHIHALHTKTPIGTLNDAQLPPASTSHCRSPREPGKNREKNQRKKRNKSLKLKETQEAARKKKELALANREDEKTIKRLEKDMHFRKNKKTKSKIMPSIFKSDGLDYLLDLVNSDSEGEPLDKTDNTSDIGDTRDVIDAAMESDAVSENEEIKAGNLKRSKRSKSCKKLKTSGSGDDENSADQDDSGHSEFGRDDDDADYEGLESEPHTSDDVDKKVQSRNIPIKRKLSHSDKQDSRSAENLNKRSQSKMDPYGNLIGEAAPKQSSGSYVPPHKRAEMIGNDSKKRKQLERLQKQLKGLINRLSETNIQSISQQIEEFYLVNSRNDMNELLTQLVLDPCIGVILTGERLVMEHAMLIAVLNVNVGMEVGAHFIETLACKLNELHKESGDYGSGKQCDNIVLVFSHLYNFKVIHCTLMYDIVHKLVSQFTERDIEMLLIILKNTGLMLRKDDPFALKEIIMQIQSKANTCSEEFRQQSRVKFMLETIYAIRNNNVRKIPNYDPTQMDHMKKILRSLVKAKGHTDSDATLRISLENLHKAEERGRWWIVGSSWTSAEPKMREQIDPATGQKGQESNVATETDNIIAKLSRQQRMNTDLRKAIFSVVMTAEDYLDGYEKLLHLNLKVGQEREVIHVVINCCQQEAKFNPYYAHLGSKLCQHDRKYKMAFQFALWDKFKILDEMSNRNLNNLALLLSQMLLSKALSISVLKVIEFADINKVTVKFLRKTLQSLLFGPSQETVASVFRVVALSPKLQFFRESLRLFLLHFLLPKNDRQKLDEMSEETLKARIKLANEVLSGQDSNARL